MNSGKLEHTYDLSNVRESNFELMRIFCMILILLSHYAIHGGFSFQNSISANRLIIQLLSTFGEIGVTGFALITGYFQMEKEFRFEKVKRIWRQVLFYSIVCFLLYALLIDLRSFTVGNVIKAFFPIVTVEYWFATTYLCLYILSPYLNAMIKNISQERLLKLIVFLILIWYVLFPFFNVGNIGSTSLGLLMLCYLIGAYFKLYYTKQKMELSNVLLLGGGYLGLLLYMLTLDILSIQYDMLQKYINLFIHLNSIFVLATGIGVFVVFKHLSITSIWINKYAKYMFGLYLFHDNSYMRKILWETLFRNSSYQETPYLFFHILISCFVVLIIAFVVEYVRKWMDKKILKKVQKEI